MPKHRDPTLMEKLQREDRIQESRLRSSAKKNLSPKQGLKKAVKIPNPEGMGQRGLPR